MRWITLIGLCGLTAAIGCGSDDDDGGTRPYRATIVRTAYGIPHITADNYGDLGFGDGYAYAQDNFCTLMREVVAANGQSARYFGENGGDLSDDYVYSFYNTDQIIEEEFFPSQTDTMLEMLRGYAAGVSQYLSDTGVENLAEDCRSGAWVRPITDFDIAKVVRKLVLFASTGQLTSAVIDAEPPTQSVAQLGPVQSAPIDLGHLIPDPTTFGSNAYGIGSDGSQTGYGLLLGNPHFPWRGNRRFYMHHLTIPGEFDVMGATLTGLPVVLIGFNRNIAWSHTVSTGRRFSIYEVELLEDDPMKYRYDGEVRDIEAVPVTIEVLLEDGSVEERTENIYMTHYGPVIEGGGLSSLLSGWPTILGTLLTYRDANLTNDRSATYWEAVDKAQSIDDLEEASKIIGNPWANTIAADRAGEAFYGDITVVPHISREKLDQCNDSLITGGINDAGVPALNGSNSECEWGSDEDAPIDGILGYANLPKLRTRDYVGNSNDSYWLSNPHMLLTGFSPALGREEIPQSLRTRMGFAQAEARMDATDGKSDTPGYDLDLLQDMLYSNMDIAEQLTRPDVVAICDAVTDWTAGDCNANRDGNQAYSQNPDQAAAACETIAGWDGRYDLESVGASVWREFWTRVRNTENLWAVPFDPADPVYTPSDLNYEDASVVEEVRCSLGGAVDRLVEAQIPIDRPWGEAQFSWNGDRTERIPIHGGRGQSTFSVIGSNLVNGEGYSNIPSGNSYIQTVTWDETECPDAFAVITYSQSTDRSSPHYSDMTELYSDKGWVDMPFCPDDVAADTISTLEVSN